MLRQAPMRVFAWVSTGVADGVGVGVGEGVGAGAGAGAGAGVAPELPPPQAGIAARQTKAAQSFQPFARSVGRPLTD